jgi:hypothetical protein
MHGFDQIARLKRDTFKGSTAKLGAPGAARQAEESRLAPWHPDAARQARQRPGHQHHALRGISLVRPERPASFACLMTPKPIARPLHRSTGNENGAFQRVMALAAVELVGDGRQQPIAATQPAPHAVSSSAGTTPCHRSSSHHARREAALPDGRSLLVARHAANGNGGTQQRGFRRAEIARAIIAHFRPGWLPGCETAAARSGIPNCRAGYRTTSCARRTGGIGRMHAPARQAPRSRSNPPSRKRAHRRSAAARAPAILSSIQASFRRGEIGISQKSGAFGQQRLMPLSAEFRAGIGSPAILPDNGAMQAAPRGAIPKQRGFALIGNADAGDISRSGAGFFQKPDAAW